MINPNYVESYNQFTYKGYLVVVFPYFDDEEPLNYDESIRFHQERNNWVKDTRIKYSIAGYYPAIEIPYTRTLDRLEVWLELMEDDYNLSCFLKRTRFDRPNGFYRAIPIIPCHLEWWLDAVELPWDKDEFLIDEWGYFKGKLLFDEDFADFDKDDIDRLVDKHFVIAKNNGRH